jgi:hypothetical protein
MCGFRHPLEALEQIPCREMGVTINIPTLNIINKCCHESPLTKSIILLMILGVFGWKLIHFFQGKRKSNEKKLLICHG